MNIKYKHYVESISQSKINGDRYMSVDYKKNGKRKKKNQGGDKHDQHNILLSEPKVKVINNIQYLAI